MNGQHSRRFASLCIPIALAVAFPTAALGDPANDLWESQRNTFESYIRSMRPLAQHRMSDVMQFNLEGGFLILRTSLSSIGPEQSMRASLDGLHGLAFVSVLREDHDDGPVEPTNFTLNVMEFPNRQIINMVVRQTAQPNEITLSRSDQTINGGSLTIIFTQRKGSPSDSAPYVQLSITEMHTQDAAPDQLNLTGPDFSTFLRDHPQETERYLRPLLRDLGQEAVFAPDSLLAWQVFNELWRPEPAITRKVESLLPLLNAEDYHQRNRALEQLRALGRDGAAALVHLNRSNLTPEQNARIDRALSHYSQVSRRAAAILRSDPRFLLDCLYCDEAALRSAAIAQLRTLIRPDLQFDVNADADARYAAIQALRAQVPLPPMAH
jgi:hypothetical protein